MFMETFKYYKSKCPPPDFSEVIDLDATVASAGVSELPVYYEGTLSSLPPGLMAPYTWKCYRLNAHPGLIVIRNPFTTKGQRFWIARCLRDYPRRPNVVNLNAKKFAQPVIDDWWKELQNCSDKDEARKMKNAMRWATLGYHHDWDSKVYNEHMRTPFPDDLAKLTRFFSEVIGLKGFNAEAAIINFYPIGTTLAGHTDHSELNLDAPLFSFSFGQTAIFLIGGRTKAERPSAVFLRSGDVVVMSHEARLCYHAVPRIIKAKVETWNEVQNKHANPEYSTKKFKSELKNLHSEWSTEAMLYDQLMDEVVWAPFRNYLINARININVRQVLYAGQKSLQ